MDLGRYPVVDLGRRHDHGVDLGDPVQPVRDIHPDPSVRGHRSGGHSADEGPVPGDTEVARPVDPEDIVGDTEFEEAHPVADHDPDRMPTPR